MYFSESPSYSMSIMTKCHNQALHAGSYYTVNNVPCAVGMRSSSLAFFCWLTASGGQSLLESTFHLNLKALL